jgi:acyl-CoA thioester hydrolase
MDTDAAGIWHYSTIIRWAEEAESELHRQLGIIAETFGVTPRAHVEFDFRASVRFDDEVTVMLAIDQVGETSITYTVNLDGPVGTVATGQIVAVLIDRTTGRKRGWPDYLRQALEGRTLER